MSDDGEKLFNWLESVKKKPYLVSVGLLGVFLLGVGVLSAMMIAGKSVDSGVEIVGVEEVDGIGEIMVDVSGAVIKPGLYKLDEGARINDALATAGGISEKADRDWFSKNLNLAMKLTDGQKLYIPFEEEMTKDTPSQGKEVFLTENININTASVSQLDTLWGVGEVTAKKIIEGRPYGSVEELLTKKVVNSNVYERIKDEVSVY